MQNLLHLDSYLPHLVSQYGTGIYGILFGIVFCETGLVVLPFLPGDSLLFASGALNLLSTPLLYPLFFVAALCGDNLNYWLGRTLGRKLFSNESSKFFNRGHLRKTETFFERYGTKAVILARFVPVVRTFAPFVAGMGCMAYGRFLAFSVIGAALWVGICVTAGRLFGQIPAVHKHFELVVLAIVAVSLLPLAVEYVNHRRAAGGGARA